MAESDKRLLDLVEEALSIAPDKRATWLQQAFGDDSSLKAQVESLLEFENDDEDFLQVGKPTTDVRLLKFFDTVPNQHHLTELQTDVQLGDYVIEKQIGAGGMGVVYRALQVSLNRVVAVKMLPASMRSMPKALVRFRREVEAAARLQHDNIVAVHSAGQDNGTAYYSMELIEGPSLEQILAYLRQEPVPELGIHATSSRSRPDVEDPIMDLRAWVRPLLQPEPTRETVTTSSSPMSRPANYFDVVATLLAGVADGLEFAHKQSVVHRDIKPSNLLLSDNGRLHISDFGLARIATDPSMTETGEFVGTPYYMAPEQVGHNPNSVDGRTDVYALGATLYEMLTLAKPHPGENRDQVLSGILHETPQSPRRLNHRIPKDLETICLKALEKEPTHRYQSAGELAADLRRFVEHLPIAARRSSISARTLKWCRRHRSMAASLLFAFSLIVLATALAYRAHDLDRKKDHAEQQRDVVTARATQIEKDLLAARKAVNFAQQTEQQRVFQDALVAAMQGDQDVLKQALIEVEQLHAPAERLHILRAQEAMFSANFQDALDELKVAVKLKPNSVAANSLLAETYARIDRPSLSLKYLNKVKTLEPTSVEDLILKGRMESYINAETAEQTLDTAIDLDRQNIAARLIRGGIRAQRAYDTCDAAHAERALEDLHLAGTLLDDTPYLLSQFMNAHLTASAAYDAARSNKARDDHLVQAGIIAEKLATFDNDYESHRWRAYYFERVGELEKAIEQWQAIDDKTIGYLIMLLYRVGRFDEAFAACDEYGATSTTGTAEFCHSFVKAATATSAQELIKDFRLNTLVSKDRDAVVRSTHILWCMAGMPGRAAEEIEEINVSDQVTSRNASRYAFWKREITAEQYLVSVSQSRYEQARAHFVIGIQRLAEGQRSLAREHFKASIAYRFDYSFFHAMSTAILSQMSREPTWPPWIFQ